MVDLGGHRLALEQSIVNRVLFGLLFVLLALSGRQRAGEVDGQNGESNDEPFDMHDLNRVGGSVDNGKNYRLSLNCKRKK